MSEEIKTKHDLHNKFIDTTMGILGKRKNIGNDANYEAARKMWNIVEPYINLIPDKKHL